jgi:hypothetical protein
VKLENYAIHHINTEVEEKNTGHYCWLMALFCEDGIT